MTDEGLVLFPANLYTAVEGGETEVQAVDQVVKLIIPAGTASGKVFNQRGLSMPTFKKLDKRDDLFARVEVKLP